MKAKTLIWEIIGIIFIFLFGSLLHFVFEWSGESKIVGMFAAVNESVWEHFKLGFLPTCVYGAIEYKFMSGLKNNFFIAKAAAVYVIPIVISALFYSYTWIIGREILILDIFIFLIAVIAAQLVSYKILTVSRTFPRANTISIFLIVFQAFMLILFTFSPPHLPIFMDNTGVYGIP